MSVGLDKHFQHKIFALPTTLAYVLVAQKNHLIETALLFWLKNKNNIFLLCLNGDKDKF